MIVPIPTNIDPHGEAQYFAGMAGRAILFGDTRQARELHEKAGRVYEADVLNRRKRSDKDALRYLAATQYYHGGLYDKALQLCRKIQANLLPNRYRKNYAEFLKAVHERAEQKYVEKMREQVKQHLRKGEYQQGLDLLKEHQYIEDEADLAFIRGHCCEQLGKYEVAAIFFADFVRKSPENLGLVLLSTTGPLGLIANNNINEVWIYTQALLDKLSHPLTYLTASVVRYMQALRTAEDTAKHVFFEEQLRLFQEAEQRFSQLPTGGQRDALWRELMRLGFAQAIIAYRNIGQMANGEATLDRALVFAPDDPFLRTLESTLRGPDADADKAFRAVIEFGDAVTNKLSKSKSRFAA